MVVSGFEYHFFVIIITMACGVVGSRKRMCELSVISPWESRPKKQQQPPANEAERGSTTLVTSSNDSVSSACIFEAVSSGANDANADDVSVVVAAADIKIVPVTFQYESMKMEMDFVICATWQDLERQYRPLENYAARHRPDIVDARLSSLVASVWPVVDKEIITRHVVFSTVSLTERYFCSGPACPDVRLVFYACLWISTKVDDGDSDIDLSSAFVSKFGLTYPSHELRRVEKHVLEVLSYRVTDVCADNFLEWALAFMKRTLNLIDMDPAAEVCWDHLQETVGHTILLPYLPSEVAAACLSIGFRAQSPMLCDILKVDPTQVNTIREHVEGLVAGKVE
jgi:hypothetical protein